MDTAKDALERAIQEAGGGAVVARHLGITAQAVSGWTVCPPRRALMLAQLVASKGGSVTAADLCPGVFQQPEARAA